MKTNHTYRTLKNTQGLLRIGIVGIAVLGQLIVLIVFVILLQQNAIYLYMILEMAGIIQVLVLIEKERNHAYTIAWMTIILVIPVFGYILYLLWGRSGTHSKKSKKIYQILSGGDKWLKHNYQTGEELEKQYPLKRRIYRYFKKEGFPLYKNTTCQYFPLGELQFQEMLTDMENAKHFIFLEFFIISRGELWNRIYGILARKASEGVEVRILYDDMGCILSLPVNFEKMLAAGDIQAKPFNSVHKYLSRLYLNYRNHQKIVVIDGQIGYTGGTNLADEYINLYEKHGHWKDSGIRITGDAVWSLTVTFLQMWEVENGVTEDYEKYHPHTNVLGDGFYQPFNDGPVNHPHNPAEEGYLQLINSAQDYVWITTPYLVIDNIMRDALCKAALGGVDVRIITPKIWDHWYVHMVTRANYGKLLAAGVRIYEYTPGYIHSKTILSDDIQAITGSINLDYRSFYLHFENGVSIYGAPVLKDIKEDMHATFALSEEIFYEQWLDRPWNIKVIQAFLHLFVPLL